MKRLVALILICCVLFSLCACNDAASNETATNNAASNTEDVEVIKIGVAAPISGENAAGGKYLTTSVSLFGESKNYEVTNKATGKTYKFEYVMEDTEGKPDITANVYRRLIEEDKVMAIIGPDNSAPMLAAAPIAQDAKIPAISTFATNEKVTQVGDYIFRACFIDPFQGKVAAYYAYNDLGARKAALLFNNGDDFPNGLSKAFIENFEALGGEIVCNQQYTGTEIKDYSAQLNEIKASDADVLFVPNSYAQLPLQAIQIKQMGIDIPIVGGDGWDVQDVVTIAGDALVGIEYVCAFSYESQEPAAQEFSKMYFEATGEQANSNVALAWEAAALMHMAIENAAEVSPQGIRDAMAQLQNVDLPSGKFSFDENRNGVKAAIIQRYDEELNRRYVTTVNPE